MTDPNTVTIPREEYRRLLAREAKLDALECGGVDNWEGYGDALGYDDDEDEDEE